ncbi:MAG: N-acetylmuramoyl-L-alanine amidase [Bacteroidales bacterium]|nr:N-acetylmuramoyl-L-alanine amidase [Bacteroidales bacterium]
MKRFLCILASLVLVCAINAARKVTWVIDPGHGGRDVGCESQHHCEKDITLKVAKELGKLVKKNINGVRVVYTRERDKYLSLQERCDIANARGATLFISIHVNAAPNPYARGTESFYATNVPLKGAQAGKSELLALLLQKQYLAHGREISRGVKKRELYVCENTNMPCVLTEIGFITNHVEEAYISSKEGQHELATAICEALMEYQKMTKNGSIDRRQLQNLRYSHYAPLKMVNVQVSTPKVETDVEKAEERAEVIKDNQAKAKAEEQARNKAEEAARVQAEEEMKLKAEAEAQAQAVANTPAETEKEVKFGNSEKARTGVGGQQTATAKSASHSEAIADSKSTASGGTSSVNQSVGGSSSGILSSDGTTSLPYFAIQLMNTSAKLKDGDYRLKGYTNVRYIPAGGRFKVIYSRSNDYQTIKNELVQVRETFPEAFIVAFLGEQQITTAEALKLIKK